MSPKRPLPPLSGAQLEIMNVAWQRGECTVADVLASVRVRRRVSRNTIQTMLSRLEDKGWLAHRDDRGTFVYWPRVPRGQVQRQVLRDMVDTVFDGSAEGIVMALLEERTLSSAEAARIRRLIKEAEERE